MTKQFVILSFLSILSVLVFSVESLAIKSNTNSSNFDSVDEVLITIIHKCKHQFTHVIIIDDDYHEAIFDTSSILQSLIDTSFRLFSIPKAITKQLIKFEVITSNGLIIVLTNNISTDILHSIIRLMRCYENCVTFIITKYQNICENYTEYFSYLNKINVKTVYFICLQEKDYIVYTLDWYGNKKNENWKIANSTKITNKLRAVYYCIFVKDNVCSALNFIRIDKPSINIGLAERSRDKKCNARNIKRFFQRNNKTECAFMKEDLRNMEAIERLIKIPFFYIFRVDDHSKHYFSRSDNINNNDNGFINVVLKEHLINNNLEYIIYSYPLHFEDYVIISHKQGPATPLEKVARFYGRITLISLMVLSTLTLVVILFNTNFKLASAVFNILRLLINTSITVSINTLPLRIFFSVIFLYFLIIHATFSGHLAKFLTVDAYYDNIETVEDLAQSRIKYIHVLDDDFTKHFRKTSIYQKMIATSSHNVCIHPMYKYKDTACIGIRSESQKIVKENRFDDKLYISKKKLWTTSSKLLYKRRFYWAEKFDWALMFLTETKIYNWWEDRKKDKINQDIIKQQTNSHTEFRPIRLKDLKFAFILLISGYILSLASFFIELFIKRIFYKVKKISRIYVRPK